MIFYHKALTSQDIHDILDKYTDDESNMVMSSMGKQLTKISTRIAFDIRVP